MHQGLIATLVLTMATVAVGQWTDHEAGSLAHGYDASAYESQRAVDAVAAPEERFNAESWTFQTYGSATFGDDAGELYLGRAGVGYHAWDDISVNLEVVTGGFRHQR